jgi:hypothetical protein
VALLTVLLIADGFVDMMASLSNDFRVATEIERFPVWYGNRRSTAYAAISPSVGTNYRGIVCSVCDGQNIGTRIRDGCPRSYRNLLS